MNTQRRVFEKLAEISQTQSKFTNHQRGRKTNLAIADDLQDINDRISFSLDSGANVRSMMNTAWDNINAQMDELNDNAVILRANKKSLEDQLTIVMDLMLRASGAASELGIDVSAIQGYSQAVKLQEMGLRQYEEMERLEEAYNEISWNPMNPF